MPFRLAAVDLDDTLLGHDKLISSANADAISLLRERGLRVVLASGRRHENMLKYWKQLGLSDIIVSCNGAMAKDEASGETLWERLLPAPLAAQVLDEGAKRGVTQNFYHTDGGLYVQERTPHTELYQSRTGTTLTYHGDLRTLAGQSPLKIIWVLPPPDALRLLDEMGALLGPGIHLTITDPEYLEFMAAGVNKAAGIAVAAERYGIAPEEVIAFGDGNNDIEMLAWAGYGVAMPHARPVAKAAANTVGPEGNIETSFARAVQRLTNEGLV